MDCVATLHEGSDVTAPRWAKAGPLQTLRERNGCNLHDLVAVGTRIPPRPPGHRRRLPAPVPTERGVLPTYSAFRASKTAEAIHTLEAHMSALQSFRDAARTAGQLSAAITGRRL
jgi:hypothetical protein